MRLHETSNTQGPERIAILPGEPFGSYSVRLREGTLGDDLVVVEQANGCPAYFPTAEEWSLGGYESDADFFAPETESVLMDAAREAIAAV